MADLICPVCQREARPEDGPFCGSCITPYVSRGGAAETVEVSTHTAPSPPFGSGSTSMTQSPSAAPACPDRDCPHGQVVPTQRCRACGRAAHRPVPVLDCPWGPVVLSEDGGLTLGREASPLAERLADYSNVGRRHAQVRRSGAAVVVVDLRSRNGTFVNDERLPPEEPRSLSPGDRVRLAADLTMVFNIRRPS